MPRAGHFAALDQPRFVAGQIVEFIRNHLNNRIAGPFLGFEGIWKGDERRFIKLLQRQERPSVTAIIAASSAASGREEEAAESSATVPART